MLALLSLRGACIWIGDVLAQRGSSRIKARLRERLTGRLLTLGPAYTQGERSGELVNTVVEGVEALDDYFTQFLPARFLAGLVPAFVLLVVLFLDPWTTLVLLVAGPFLILLLALIGGRTQDITERRFRELSWLSAHFLDMLQGLPTLKLFGRSREQAANIESISRHYGDTTMEVLRTAFQTSLVMEWAATAATALVALEVSLRLMNGMLPFERALAVLLLTPEFFLPLRQMALKISRRDRGQDRGGTHLRDPGYAGNLGSVRCCRRFRARQPCRRDATSPLRMFPCAYEGGAAAGPARAFAYHTRGQDRGPGRADRRGQDDRRQPAAALHRAGLRLDQCGWHTAASHRAGSLAQAGGLGVASALPVPRHGRRQHPVGQAGSRDGRGDRRSTRRPRP